MQIIIWIVIGAAAAIITGYLFLEARKYKIMYSELDTSYADAMDRAMDSERRAGKAEAEVNFHKQTINMILQRPAISAMNEDQFQALVNTITAAVQAANKQPNQMN